jgi:hypothetical protein
MVVNGALLKEGIFVSLCELDIEAGGDPYMQLARSYDLAVKVLQDGGGGVFEAGYTNVSALCHRCVRYGIISALVQVYLDCVQDLCFWRQAAFMMAKK